MLKTKQKLIPLAIAAAFGLQAQSVMALPVQLSLNAETTATSDGNTDSNTGTTNSSGNYTYSSSSAYSSKGDSYANTGGNTSGWFYANASTYGSNSSASSTFTQSYSITNDTGLTQLLDFSFKVNAGALSVYNTSNSGYTAQILLNNNAIWSSAASLEQSSNGLQFTQSGVSLGNYSANSNYYSWSNQDFNMALGQIGVGQTYNLQYIVNTFAESDLSGNTNCGYNEGYGDGYGDGEVVAMTTSQEEGDGYGCSSSGARFGDPNGFKNTPAFTITAKAANPVNEPASIALVGAGLAGLAFMRRRKDKKA